MELTVTKTIDITAEKPRPLDGQTNVLPNRAFNTRDGGFLQILGQGSPYSLKWFAADGAILWSMSIADIQVDLTPDTDSIIEADDGNIVLLSAGARFRDTTQAYRIATNGRILSQVSLGGWSGSIHRIEDGYLVTRVVDDAQGTYMARFTTNLSLTGQWQPAPPGTGGGRSMRTEADGSFVFASALRSVTKVRSDGSVAWSRTGIGNASTLPSLQQSIVGVVPTRDHGYLLAGTDIVVVEPVHHADYDYLIVKIGSGGELQWVRRFGGTGNDDLRSVFETEDGGFLLCGNSESEEVSGNKGVPGIGNWIIKTDSRGLKQSEMVVPAGSLWVTDAVRTPAGFALVGLKAGRLDLPVHRWDLTVRHRAHVSARSPSGLPYSVDVSNDLEHWSPVVVGFGGDLELRDEVKTPARFWRAYEVP